MKPTYISRTKKRKYNVVNCTFSRKGLLQETAEAIQKILLLNYNVQKTD